METFHHKVWKLKSDQLRDQLTALKLRETLDIDNLESFNLALGKLFNQYATSPLEEFVNKKLSRHFEHINAFHKAVSATTQQIAIASYIWSALLAVIECTCRHVSHVQETLEHIEKFYRSFPVFEKYMRIFPHSPNLRASLQDLYATYADFCLLTINYMSKGTIAHIARNIFSSKPRRDLESILKQWSNQTADFERTANLEFTEQVMRKLSSQDLSSGDVVRPSKTNILRREEPYFTGRQQLLDQLHEKLNNNIGQASSYPSACLIHALGGMGKTQAALAYSSRFEIFYEYRFWVKAEASDRLLDSLTSISKILGIKNDGKDYLSPVKDWLENTDKSWLLIFDNVEKDTINAIKAFLQAQVSQGCRAAIILTSQIEHKHVAKNLSPIALESLSSEESVQLLLNCIGQDRSEHVSNGDREVLEEISTLLGNLPLAIVHVGGYISESKQNIREFRDFFKARWHRVWGKDQTTATYDSIKTLDIVWDFALDELPANARKLIHIMAYLNPDIIPWEWLSNDIASSSDWGIPSEEYKHELVDISRSLNKRCLVNTTSGGEMDQIVFSIHRSLQVGLRLKLSKDLESRSVAFDHAVSIISRSSPRASRLQIPDQGQWPAFQRSSPHTMALCHAYADSLKTKTPLRPSLELAEVLYNAGFHVWETWNPITQDGTFLLETAEKVLDSLDIGKSHRLRADILTMKCMLLDLVGLSKRSDSLRGREIVRQMRENILHEQEDEMSASTPEQSENEHLFYNSLNDLALSYLQNDLFREAEKIFYQCFAKYREWGTEYTIPFEYGKYYHNLAFVRMYQGRYQEAIELLNQGISLKLRTDGIDNSRYWWFEYEFACVLLQAGQPERALERHQSVLESRRRICGVSQEVTLQSLYTVGAMYFHLKDLLKAEEYFRDCLEKAGKVRWHARALGRVKWHLAEVLSLQNKDLEATRTLRKEALETLEAIYSSGVEPPEYLKNASTIALFDWTQPSFDGRWTGVDLLPLVQKHYGVVSQEAP